MTKPKIIYFVAHNSQRTGSRQAVY